MLVCLAIVVGVVSGFGAIFFRWLIDSISHISLVRGRELFYYLGRYDVVLIPAIGGFFVGLLVNFFAPEAEGHGVPEVMEAVALKHGHIRPVVAIIKTLASSICIGTGGSVGREGPIVQIGSSLASMLGQWLRLSGDSVRTLVACGAAGGIAATFNAPISGAIFAAEVILCRFNTRYFVPIIIASVTANEISRIFLGNSPAFAVPAYKLVSAWEFFLYAALGVLAALTAVSFIRVLYRFDDFFDAWHFPNHLKPAVGGVGIGLIGVYFPEIFGVGYETIEDVLQNMSTEAMILVLLLVIKLVATSLTLSSGGSGGIFAPSLFMGSMLGGGFGILVHTWFVEWTASSGAYALVGMAAVFAGAAQAPLTAVLILFEMTRDYGIILPLALTVAFSTVLTRFLQPESIYTLKLKRRGVDFSVFENVDLLRTIRVGEAMSPISRLVTVDPDLPLKKLTALYQEHHSHGFAVVSEDNRFVGIVTLTDVEGAVRSGEMDKKVDDICTKQVRYVFPDQTLEDTLTYFGSLNLGRLPVVAREDPNRLVGMLGRADIVRAISQIYASQSG